MEFELDSSPTLRKSPQGQSYQNKILENVICYRGILCSYYNNINNQKNKVELSIVKDALSDDCLNELTIFQFDVSYITSKNNYD